MKPEPLRKCFYGDFYYDSKNKKISKKDSSGKKKTIFTQYALSALHMVYQKVTESDFESLQRVALSFGVSFNQNDLKNNPKAVCNEILHKWLPIEITVFKCIIEQLPNSVDGQFKRIKEISENWSGREMLKNEIMSCSANGNPVAVISKFLPIKMENGLRFVGFGRLLKGSMKVGDSVTLWNVKNEKF